MKAVNVHEAKTNFSSLLAWLEANRETIQAINEAPAACVSAISGFEIALKVRSGKLDLSRPVTSWFERVVEHHGLTVLSLELDVCVTAADLPVIHDDPFDRFIIAAAKLHDWTVVTADPRFERYGLAVIC